MNEYLQNSKLHSSGRLRLQMFWKPVDNHSLVSVNYAVNKQYCQLYTTGDTTTVQCYSVYLGRPTVIHIVGIAFQLYCTEQYSCGNGNKAFCKFNWLLGLNYYKHFSWIQLNFMKQRQTT